MALIVNGEQIDDSVIHQEAQRLRPDYERFFKDQSPAQQQKQLLQWSEENVIERVLINQQARKSDYSVPAAELDSAVAEAEKQHTVNGKGEKLSARTLEKIRADVELELKVQHLLQDICKDLPQPSARQIRQFYEQNKAQFERPEQLRVGHIVKHIDWKTDDRAAVDIMEKVQGLLNSGAVFETLAAEYSDCPENGGDLGYITRGQMVEEFDDVVFNLGPGQVSDVFRTRFGFHIARVYDRKPPVIAELEEVKETIAEELKNQMQVQAIYDFVDDLKSKARISGP